jgi:hypothetical protein
MKHWIFKIGDQAHCPDMHGSANVFDNTPGNSKRVSG